MPGGGLAHASSVQWAMKRPTGLPCGDSRAMEWIPGRGNQDTLPLEKRQLSGRFLGPLVEAPL